MSSFTIKSQVIIPQNKKQQSSTNATMKKFKVSMTIMACICMFSCQQKLVTCQQQQQRHLAGDTFPGVSKDLASFCAARPSLPIDLASMIVHVKRNVSFNYKLYLFSGDYVFQTGQVIPRDDFRVHSFPVKVKRFQDFWPLNSSTSAHLVELKEFFRLVPLNEPWSGRKKRKQMAPHDASGDPLPGDHIPHEPFISHDRDDDVERQHHKRQTENPNKFIEFDRDDQVSRLNFHPDSSSFRSPDTGGPPKSTRHANPQRPTAFEQLVLPVGSFSSFHVNLTYLVRKDFDQIEPRLLKLLVDANKFQVTQWEEVQQFGGSSINNNSSADRKSAISSSSSSSSSDDFGFLSHKLLRDLNTRITSINQIYEDWITRNFYTIVYVQRRLFSDDDDLAGGEQEAEAGREQTTTKRTATATTITNERLIFRGSSAALLGADQLDYQVKAAAFITEKNGLHYFIEFLNTGKFYLCAVDWHKRPFKIIDWQQFPIKATRTQLDNEELLLCPPAVCFAQQPIDEIVSYGRLDLAEQIQRQISKLSLVAVAAAAAALNKQSEPFHQEQQVNETSTPIKLSPSVNVDETATSARLRGRSAAGNGLDQIIEAVMIAAISASGGSLGLQQTNAVKLHLRDWVWTLSINSSKQQQQSVTDNNKKRQPGGLFQWRYELAKRNDIKAKQDAYGYTLTGHEIDASYRIYNELYLISANHLIAINYTLSNETVVSSIPVSEEFPGLVSTLIDPITGAFYDRYANRLYFFKGDRYIGFDYATKKPLEDFVLKPSYLHAALWGALDSENSDGPRLLSSQPVVEILGRQHQVDAIYHDLATDQVHIFAGMKFYSFRASEFKDGAFRSKTGELPQMHCINDRFLEGCHFDKAFPNPCESMDAHHQSNAKLTQQQPAAATTTAAAAGDHDDGTMTIVESLKDFNQEQQMKLRSIASKAGLLNVLLENSLISKGIRTLVDAGQDVKRDPSDRDQEKLIIYLLMAIVVVTILVTLAMILVMISATSKRSKSSRTQCAVLDQLNSSQLARHSADKIVAIKQMSDRNPNKQYHSRIRPYHVPSAITNRSALANAKPVGTVSITMSKSRKHRDDIDNSVL